MPATRKWRNRLQVLMGSVKAHCQRTGHKEESSTVTVCHDNTLFPWRQFGKNSLIPMVLIPLVLHTMLNEQEFSLAKLNSQTTLSDHLTCLLRNLYAGQEATVRTGHGKTDWFQIGKGVRQACTVSLCLFNLYAEHILQNAMLDEAQRESRLLGEILISSDMQMTPPLQQKPKRN